MSDDYLWDGSGPIDPTIARLERALAPLRRAAARRPRALLAAAIGPAAPAAHEAPRRSPWLLAGALGVAFAAAAAVMLLPSTAVGPAHTAIAGRGGGRIDRGAATTSPTSAGGIAGFGGAGGYGGS